MCVGENAISVICRCFSGVVKICHIFNTNMNALQLIGLPYVMKTHHLVARVRCLLDAISFLCLSVVQVYKTVLA